MPRVRNLRTNRVVEVNDDHWALTDAGFERVEDTAPPPAPVETPESEATRPPVRKPKARK